MSEDADAAAPRASGLSGWLGERRRTSVGVKGGGLGLVLAGALTAVLSLTSERTFGMVPVYTPGMGWSVWSLVTEGRLAAPLVGSLLCPVILLASTRTFGRILAAACGVSAAVAVWIDGSHFVEACDAPRPGGFDALEWGTLTVALGACLCLVRPRRAS